MTLNLTQVLFFSILIELCLPSFGVYLHLCHSCFFIFSLQLPKMGVLWNVYMNFNQKRLLPWESIIPPFKYSGEQPFFEMLVPTTDTVRFGYLMEKLLFVRRSVLFTGGTGVGKVSMKGYGKNLSNTVTCCSLC